MYLVLQLLGIFFCVTFHIGLTNSSQLLGSVVMVSINWSKDSLKAVLFVLFFRLNLGRYFDGVGLTAKWDST